MNRRYLLIFVLVGILCLSGCPSPSTQVPAVLNSLELSPSNTTVSVGATLQFSAQGKSAQGVVVTVSGLTWSVSNDIGTIDNNGLFRANKAGSCQVRVSANQGQFTAQTDLTVQGGVSPPVIPTLASIEIIPTSANLTVEDILQFTAKGKDSDDKEMALANPTWAVKGEIGTVDTSGLFTAVKAGLGKVTVTAGGKSANAAVKVKDSLVIIPTPTIAVPQPGDKTYTSKLFRFKLGYPADWALEEKETGKIVLTSPDAQSVIYHYEGENEDATITPADVAAILLEQWGIPQSAVLENTDFTAKNGLDGTRVLFSQTLDGRASQGLLYVYTKISGVNMQYSVLEGDGRGEPGMKQAVRVLEELMIQPNQLDPGGPAPTPTPTPQSQTRFFQGLNFFYLYPLTWNVNPIEEGLTEWVEFSSPDTRIYLNIFEGPIQAGTTPEEMVQEVLDYYGITPDLVSGFDQYKARNDWNAYYAGFDEEMGGIGWQAIALSLVGKNSAGQSSYITFILEGVSGSSMDEGLAILNEMLKEAKLNPP